MFLFGSFTEDEVRSMNGQPNKNDVDIMFGSLDSETLKSVGFFNTRITYVHSPEGSELSKPSSTMDDFRLRGIGETRSVLGFNFAGENGCIDHLHLGGSNVTILGENRCIGGTYPGVIDAKEIKQDSLDHIEQSSSVIPAILMDISDKLTCEKPGPLSVSGESSHLEDCLDDYSNGAGLIEMNQSTVKKTNQQIAIPRNFLPRGLVNMGNLCFLNSTLQALLSCSPFFELLHELRNRSIPENGFPTLRAFVQFISDFDVLTDPICKGDEKGVLEAGLPFRPVMFDSILKSFTPDIPDNLSGRPRQEDAQEFLSFVMHQMHDELLKLDGKLSNGNGKTVSLVSSTHDESEDDNWDVGPRNKTAITRTQSFTPSKLSAIFGGQLRSVVKARGNKASTTVQPFLLLHLNICPEPVYTIEDALRMFSAPETLEGYRTTAAGKAEVVTASKSVKILELSEILVLHLMRFSYESQRSTKLHKAVHFPLELLLGRELLASSSSEGKRYELVATITHHGRDPYKGHYTVDARHPSGKWLRYDDDSVTPIPDSKVLHDEAYVLFYKQL